MLVRAFFSKLAKTLARCTLRFDSQDQAATFQRYKQIQFSMSSAAACSQNNKAQPESPAKKSPSPGSICLALIAVWPGLAVWRDALIVGGCLILGGNGAVTFAERYVPSGETALLVGCVPILMTLFAWFAGITRRPGASIFFAMALGIGGVGVLAHAGASTSQVSAAHHLLGVIVILAGCIIWSFGSLYARRAQRAQSAVLNIGLQMFTGGVLLFVASVLAGEPAALNLGAITQRSFLAWVYLVMIGAVIG